MLILAVVVGAALIEFLDIFKVGKGKDGGNVLQLLHAIIVIIGVTIIIEKYISNVEAIL